MDQIEVGESWWRAFPFTETPSCFHADAANTPRGGLQTQALIAITVRSTVASASTASSLLNGYEPPRPVGSTSQRCTIMFRLLTTRLTAVLAAFAPVDPNAVFHIAPTPTIDKAFAMSSGC